MIMPKPGSDVVLLLAPAIWDALTEPQTHPAPCLGLMAAFHW